MKIRRIFSTIESKGPCLVSGHSSFIISDNIYVFGGFNGQSCSNDLYCYNILKKTWKKINCSGDVPSNRCSTQGQLYKNNLIIFGGTSYPFGIQSFNDTNVLMVNTNHWETLKCSGDLPCSRYGHSSLINNDLMYVFGGTTGYTFFNDLYLLNLKSLRWRKVETVLTENKIESIPTPRYAHNAVSDGNFMYIVGGGYPDPSTGILELYSYCFLTKKWRKNQLFSPNKTYPENRRSFVSCLFNSKIYVHGGTDGKKTFADVWTIDLKTFNCVNIKVSYPQRVCFHSGAFSNLGCLYITGGRDLNGLNPLFNPNTFRIHCSFPSLKELCLNTLNFFLKKEFNFRITKQLVV